jgi:uncharacterized protein HemX
MFNALLMVLGAGLSLWASKEKHKYIDELTDLERKYRAEENKPIAERNDAILDNLEFKLRQLARNFATSVGKPDA